MCGHGERAMTAASLLAAPGARDIDGADRRSRGLGRRPRARSRPAHDHRRRRRSVSGCAPTSRQFALLVAVNALVGGMIGQERTVLPLLAERVFGLDAVHRRAHLHRSRSAR